MVVEVHEGPEALDRLRVPWEDLEQRCDTSVFQTYSVARTWFDAVGSPSGAVPLVAALSEDGRLVAMLPLCSVRYGRLRLLTWLGGPFVVGAGDALCDRDLPEATASAFFEEGLRAAAKRSRGALLYLTNVRDDASIASWLSSHGRAYKVGVAPYMPVVGDFESYFGSLDHDVRHSIRRHWRRLTSAGEVRFEVFSGPEAECEMTAKVLVEHSKSRHGAPGQRTNLFDPLYAEFRVCQACGDPNVRLARLTLDGRTIAEQLYYHYRDEVDLAICGFDQEFSAFSPGILLMRCVVERCFDSGVRVIDLGEGDDAYKRNWTSLQRGLTTYTSADLPGWILATAAGARRRLAQSSSR